MAVKCVYCGKNIKNNEHMDGVSHGVCCDCLPGVLEEFNIPLMDYLENITYPALLVTEDGVILGENEEYRKTINIQPNILSDALNATFSE